MRQQLRPFIHLLINSSIANWWNQKTCENILLLLSGWFCHSKLHKFSRILVFFFLSTDNDAMVACVASVSVWLRRTRVKDRAKNGVLLGSETTRKPLLRRLICYGGDIETLCLTFFLYIIFILKLEEYSVKYQFFVIHYRPCRGWGCWYNNASLLFIWGYSEHCF